MQPTKYFSRHLITCQKSYLTKHFIPQQKYNHLPNMSSHRIYYDSSSVFFDQTSPISYVIICTSYHSLNMSSNLIYYLILGILLSTKYTILLSMLSSTRNVFIRIFYYLSSILSH